MRKSGMFFPTEELAVLHIVEVDVLDKPFKLSQLDYQALS
jgi:hypothetical protein